MKALLASFCLSFAFCADAQYGPGGKYLTPIPANPPPEEPKVTILITNFNDYGQPEVTYTRVNARDYYNAQAQQQYQATLAQQAAQAAAQQAINQRIQGIYSKDPWRRINDLTNYDAGKGWFEFGGVVQETRGEGVIFRGKWGDIQTFDSSGSRGISGDDLFFVENFSYPAQVGQLYAEMMAFDSGYFTYTNNGQQKITIRSLDYGTPCVKIFTPEEIAAQQLAADPRKAALDRALKANQAMADRGDAYGLLRMGERYRDGDGVTKDLQKARDYLMKAVTAGSLTGVDELSKLNQVIANSPATQ
jgi:TPR repeat protein